MMDTISRVPYYAVLRCLGIRCSGHPHKQAMHASKRASDVGHGYPPDQMDTRHGHEDCMSQVLQLQRADDMCIKDCEAGPK
jgi:hypothetical protein